MKSDIEIIADRLKMELEDLGMLDRKVSGKTLDGDGRNTAMLSSSYRFIGVARYVLDHDVLQFKECLAESSRLYHGLFLRYENGEPISPSFLAMIAYQELLHALAAGDPILAERLATVMGGRTAIEKVHDHPFDRSFGYALKWAVSGQRSELETSLEHFINICQTKPFRDFSGYATMFSAMLNGDDRLAADAVPTITAGHARQSRGRGLFSKPSDRILCVWGIGIVNLARSFYNLKAPAMPPLIPEELLMPPHQYPPAGRRPKSPEAVDEE